MAAQKKIWDTDMTLAEKRLHLLKGLISPHQSNTIQAQWFTIRTSPDLATGELLNVGVGVLHEGKVYTKVLPSAAPFKLLYGQKGWDNFSFLLNLISQQLNGNNWQKPFSPQIQISPPQFVAGKSIEEILQRLYTSMVTLSSLKDEEVNQARNISTQDLRRIVGQQMKQDKPDLSKRIWHNGDDPIIIPAQWQQKNKYTELNHIQLWSPPDITNPAFRFGSFVSVDYSRLNFAELPLLQSVFDIQEAYLSIHTAKKRAGLFIYRPECSTNQKKIDNLIDKNQWVLKKQLGTDFLMEVESNIGKLTEHSCAFAA